MDRPAQAPSRRRADASAPAPTLELERFLPYRLSVLAQRVSNDLHARYADRFGLTVPQWRTMACLGRFAPLSANAICARIVMDKVAVSRALAALTGKGLVDSATDPADRRRSALRLTTAGRRIHDAIVPTALDYEASLWSGLATDERRILESLLEKLHARAIALARVDEPN